MRLREVMVACAALLWGAAASAATYSFQWAPASGPVAAYDVYVQRDGGPYAFDQTVAGTTADVQCTAGESFTVRVWAKDALGAVGPLSVASGGVFCQEPGEAVGQPGQPAPAAS